MPIQVGIIDTSGIHTVREFVTFDHDSNTATYVLPNATDIGYIEARPLVTPTVVMKRNLSKALNGNDKVTLSLKLPASKSTLVDDKDYAFAQISVSLTAPRGTDVEVVKMLLDGASHLIAQDGAALEYGDFSSLAQTHILPA